MIKRGGTPAEAKKLADEFQELIVDVDVRSQGDQGRERHHQGEGAAGTKKKEPGKLPNEFVTNDDFCPGCGLELKSLPVERNNLWTDVFQRDLAGRLRSGAGVRAHQARAAGIPRLGPRAAAERRPAALRRRPARRHRGAAQGAAAEVCVRARRRRRRERRSNLQGQHSRQPLQSRRRGAAAFPVGARRRTIRRRSRRAAAVWNWPTPSCASRSRCASSSIASGRDISAPGWSTRRATSA